MDEEGTQMKRRRHTPEQVVRKLREAKKMLDEGKTISEVAKELEVSENTFHRWRAQYGGGMKADDVKRLKELERENTRLNRIVADRSSRSTRSKRWRRESGRPGPAAPGDPVAAGSQGPVGVSGV
jgi:putative transposase